MNILINYIVLSFAIIPLCAQERQLPDVSPEKIEFAWDCHGVLLKANVWSMVKIGFSEGTMPVLAFLGGLCADIVRAVYSREAGASIRLLKDIRALLKTPGGVTAQNFKGVLNDYDKRLWPLALKMAAQHRALPGMQELVDELHALGYTQRVATNMGDEEFEGNRQHCPELFEHFEPGMVVLADIPGYPRKPSKDYFDLYNKQFNPTGEKTIIFMDDKLKNVAASQQCAIVGLVFKNAADLREQLQALGIPLPQAAVL